ncbi:MAG: hypothetical protein V2A76_17330 [Planctomycetota bacterium]
MSIRAPACCLGIVLYVFLGTFDTIRTMPPPSKPHLTVGRVYRTEDLRRWGKNPSRLADRLVREGKLRRLSRGHFVRPRWGRFGEVPPTDDALLRAFLKGQPFLHTGPECWNVLGLGASAVFSRQLVYNTSRTGEFDLGGVRLLLRRVRFPRKPTPEWFVIDLLENHDMAGVSLAEVEYRLAEAVSSGRFDPRLLEKMAGKYGTRRTQAIVERSTTGIAV